MGTRWADVVAWWRRGTRPTPRRLTPRPAGSALADALEGRLGVRPEACAADTGSVHAGGGYHALAEAVHNAFAHHLPLALSPDDVWLCLVQGLALHVNSDPERWRSRWVSHSGRLQVQVRRDDFAKGDAGNPWPEVFRAFSEQIRAHVGPRHDDLLPWFTTTTPASRAAAEIALLDAVQAYFQYTLTSMCGIPEVHLRGTPEDWALLRRRAQSFRDFDLAWWLDRLDPVLARVEAVAGGRRDRRLWDSLYKCNNRSGGPFATGWINLLFPYLRDPSSAAAVRNPHLDRWQDSLGTEHGGGPTTEEFPSGLAGCPFEWEYHDTRFAMRFHAGFVGTTTEADTGALRPVVGWAVSEDPAPS